MADGRLAPHADLQPPQHAHAALSLSPSTVKMPVCVTEMACPLCMHACRPTFEVVLDELARMQAKQTALRRSSSSQTGGAGEAGGQPASSEVLPTDSQVRTLQHRRAP